MTSGAVRWFSPITMSVGSTTKHLGRKLQIRKGKRLAKDLKFLIGVTFFVSSTYTVLQNPTLPPDPGHCGISRGNRVFSRDLHVPHRLSNHSGGDHDHDPP